MIGAHAQEDAAAAGMGVVRACLHALADGDDARALATINAADREVTAWACATLLAALRESISGRVNGKPHRLVMALRAAAEGMTQDIVLTQVAVIVNEAERRT